MGTFNFNINFNFNNICRCCNFGRWFSPVQNFCMPGFSFFNNPILNFNRFASYLPPMTSVFGFNNFVRYQNPATDMLGFNDISYQMPMINMPSFSQPHYNSTSNWSQYSQFNSWTNLSFNTTPSWNTYNVDTFIRTSTIPFGNSNSASTGALQTSINTRNYGTLQEKFYKTGLDFVGNINSDSAGNQRFSNGRKNQWCADFVSTLAHETFGNKLPTGFPDARKHSTSVMSIKNWGEKHNRFISAPTSNISNFIASNVKPGDIMILDRGDGKGHAAIVTKINSDGSFETVGGNESNSVKHKTRKPTIKQGSQKLLGFVQMGDIA